VPRGDVTRRSKLAPVFGACKPDIFAAWRRVDGISYCVEPDGTVAIVGESGSGKSVGALSILRLIPGPPGRITRGEILLRGPQPNRCDPLHRWSGNAGCKFNLQERRRI
jgi:ABC-type dipeptide/oligopeptide/nickel transport system ATPase component